MFAEKWNAYKEDKQRLFQIFDHLLLVTLKNHTFVIFDLLTAKWFKCDKSLSIHSGTNVIDAKNNFIHFQY